MYKARREKLAAMLPENAMLFVLSGKNVHSVGDEMYPFAVDRNFYYLTGIDRSDMMYMLVKKDGEVQDMLVIERFDEMMAKWVGAKMLPAEATEISGIGQIVMDDEKWCTIHRMMARQFDHEANLNVYADLTKQDIDQVTPAYAFINEFTSKYPHLTVNNAAPMLTKLRIIKADAEVEKISKAISVTNKAILNMMDHSEAGIGENVLEAHFDFVLKCNKCKRAFPTIVGSGKNGTVLHYGENNQIAEDNTLALCDLGAAYENYSADITRTFPVNGKFTERQKQIYNIVLEANEMIISAVKPGLTLRGLNNMVIEFYEKKLAEIGLLENGKKVSDYYWHGVSHMLGLETHDVQLSNYELEPGNVFTVEPGLYLEEEGIGIRIEDDVLVTEDGCINLSKEIIKTVEDIEAYMAK
ncbi:MAG: aminopeptidase P N-terminal domain-containing protein [Tyzzerella sp.]|nr:aminopeptidase P N-terminal domain-containing protein [Tyzzerella sp.]